MLPWLLIPAALVGGWLYFQKREPAKGSSAIVTLDASLSQDEQKAVRFALLTETNPASLESFAASLDPEAPKAAALLRAQAKAIKGG